jgi:predicted transcriptional regulator
MLLEGLLGNETAERVLLYLAVNDEGYLQQLSLALGIAPSVVLKQVRRLEASGILVSRMIGRSRVYSFNPRFALKPELLSLLKKAFSLLPPKEREPFESTRMRPRRA